MPCIPVTIPLWCGGNQSAATADTVARIGPTPRAWMMRTSMIPGKLWPQKGRARVGRIMSMLPQRYTLTTPKRSQRNPPMMQEMARTRLNTPIREPVVTPRSSFRSFAMMPISGAGEIMITDVATVTTQSVTNTNQRYRGYETS